MEMKHILIAEDEAHTRLSLNILLKRAGYEVTAVPDGENASALLRDSSSKKFDLLLTDIQMPQMTGIELIRSMKKDHIDVPVIVFTGFGDKDTLVELLREGCEEYIDKPFCKEDVLKRVHNVLEKSDLQKAEKISSESHVQNLMRDMETYRMRFKELCSSVDSAIDTYNHMIEDEIRTTDIPIAVKAVTLDRLGGDYVAVRDSEKGCSVFVADVAGHDMGASYHTIMLKAFFEENCCQGHSGEDFFKMLNWQLLNNGNNERMVTALYLDVNLEDMWVQATCAAHPYLLRFKENNSKAVLRPFSSLSGDVLGLLKKPSFELRKFKIHTGDRLFIYTDGVSGSTKVDMYDGTKEKLGEKGLRELLLNNAELSLEEMTSKSWLEIREFCRFKHTDDMLLFGMEVPENNKHRK